MIEVILFDWDGTLIDTAQQAYAASKRSLEQLGIPLDRTLYERIYSPDWYRMYEELRLPRTRWKEADDLWVRFYENDNVRLMQGGEAALNQLAHGNYVLGIVTSGTRQRVLREIDALRLTDTFRIIICGEDVLNKKPHPEGLEIAMKQLGKAPAFCCYVGDSPHDIEMGKCAHVLTIGIPGPYPASRDLRNSNPDLFFNSLEEFVNHMWERLSIAVPLD